MPIYEYMCGACGHRMEALQKMSDPALSDCPACSQPQLQKQISAAGFRLAGGGWYETDFKAGGKKKNLAGDAGGSSGGSSEASSGGTASSDSSASKAPATAPSSTGGSSGAAA